MVLALGGEGPMVAAVLFTELGIAAIMIGLRGYTRYFIRGGLAPDDYALWITLVGKQQALGWFVAINTSVSRSKQHADSR